MFGLLGIIVMLGFVNYALDPTGYAMSAVIIPGVLWFVGALFLRMEFYASPDVSRP